MSSEELIRRYYESNLMDAEALALLCEEVRGLIRSIARKTAATYSCLDFEEDSGLYTVRTKCILEDLENEGFAALCQEIQKEETLRFFHKGQGAGHVPGDPEA